MAWLGTFAAVVTLAFALKISADFSRGAIFSFFLSGLVSVPLVRAIAPRLMSQWLTGYAHRGQEAVVIAPQSDLSALALRNKLLAQGCVGVHLIGFDESCTGGAWIKERRRVLQMAFNAARSARPGEIYVMGGRRPLNDVESLMSGLRLLPRAALFLPDRNLAGLLQHPIRGVGGVTSIEMQRAPMSWLERYLKRAMDIAIAIGALVFCLPLFVGVAIAIRLDSRGPILFRQKRLGYRGQPFEILKFRSMTVLEDGEAIRQATKNDQRVTKVGQWLRRTSIDELPQLWNVLIGDMSIVGPRPHAVAHDVYFAELIENYEVRQHVKPGLTGWAQVHGLRGETPHLDLMYRRIEMDIWYACNASPALDIQILFKTFGAVFSQKNAF